VIDLKLGGATDWGVCVEPHSQREHLAVLGSAVYEFFFYEEEQPDEDPSDRIHVIITTADGHKTGWLMNVQDAMIFIRGLSVCVQKAIEAGVPLTPSTTTAAATKGGNHAHC
jgi:hypothetical protein